jgi:aquaporin Z
VKKIPESCIVKPKIFIVCEFIGSMFLVIAAVAPIILFTEVLKTHIAIAVLADALSVGFVLFALVEIFGPICTAYFNPVVSIGLAISKDITWSQAFRYSFTQILGGLFGIFLIHLMFFDKVQILLTISDV